MAGFSLYKNSVITRLTLGNEHQPLLIIDNFASAPTALIRCAGEGALFEADRQNFYPGKRKPAPEAYSEQLSSLFLSQFKDIFACEYATSATTVGSAFAISDTPPDKLRPIQMLPHFDSCDTKQFAVVHYLCDPQHGGTSFYRHRSTNFESVTESRLAQYSSELKQQAMSSQLHLNPSYMQGSNTLFERLLSVDALMNRAIIYPSNILHSGNINPELGLCSQPEKGRLTLGSFIVVE